MDIRINNGANVNGITKQYYDQQTISNNRKLEKPVNGQSKDEVVLSSRAQEFSQTLKTLRKFPEVREAKIKELSANIEKGTYNIEANKIADAIIAYSKQ